jgi:hypothetical protein
LFTSHFWHESSFSKPQISLRATFHIFFYFWKKILAIEGVQLLPTTIDYNDIGGKFAGCKLPPSANYTPAVILAAVVNDTGGQQ